MLQNLDRRKFIKSSSIFSSGFILLNLLESNVIARNLILSKIPNNNLNGNSDILDCLNPNYIFLDDFIENKILIQCYEFEIGNNYTFKNVGNKQIIILCQNLTINGQFENPSGEVIIFTNKISCRNDASIIISGNKAKQDAIKQLSNCDGDKPDGTNADNIDLTGKKYDLDGANGGLCKLYFSQLAGSLHIQAKGGNGGHGEDGGDACNGRNGKNGDKDHGCFGPDGYVGENGTRPGNNGNGADGGKGGDGGVIKIYTPLSITSRSSLNMEDIITFSSGEILCNTNGGDGGTKGKGGTLQTHGGTGGIGGKKQDCVDGARGCHCRDAGKYGDGIDKSHDFGTVGIDGSTGKVGDKINIAIDPDYLSILKFIPSSFVRILILKAEFFYINNQYDNAIETLNWITTFNIYQTSQKLTSFESSKLTAYLEDEKIESYQQHFNKANLYLNQLSLGYDFFGNVNNYVTLLDSEFINDKIDNLYKYLVDFEKITAEMCTKNLEFKISKVNITSQKEKNRKRIEELKIEIDKLNNSLFKLNTEIINRQNQISDYKNRIYEKEKNFHNAVENASPGCSFLNVLSTIASIVSIVAGVVSGVGAVAAAANIVSNTAKLKNDFVEKVDTIGPWINPEKWKEVFNADNKSLINQIKAIKDEVGGFRENIKTLKEAFFEDKGQNKNLIAVAYDMNSTVLNREKFISQMKDYINKFPEAKIYEEEVLSFMDFCDITNQKRQEFTNGFLNILLYQNLIEQLEIDNSKLSLDLLKNEARKVDSTSKILFIDSYLKAKQLLLKLLYLQSKSIDYFTLTPTVFSSKLYDFGIKGLNDNYINTNQDRLINYLVNSGFGRTKDNTKRPILVTSEILPLSFSKFINGEKHNSGSTKKHVLNFRIIPKNKFFLDGNWAEIYIISAKVFIKGAKTDSQFLSFNLKHFGDGTFITSAKEKVYFSHKPVIKPLTYNLTSNAYDTKNEFSEITGDFKVKNQNPFVGVSPFAHWSIEIDTSVPLNDGLSLKDVKQIELMFDFYCKPFDSFQLSDIQ